MAKAIALTGIKTARTKLANPLDAARAVIVSACGVALLLAGPALPF